MSCRRGNCTGVPLCTATEICCLQLQQDCGGDCDGVPIGYSRLQVNAAGELEICSNVGGVCTCTEICTDCIETILSDNNCVDGGVGTDYAVREFDLTGGILTINSAPEHSSVTATNFANFGLVGIPSVGANDCVEFRVDVDMTNPSLCRPMAVMVSGSGRGDLNTPTVGGRYTIGARLEANAAIIGTYSTRFSWPYPNIGVLQEAKSISSAGTHTLAPGATGTYSFIIVMCSVDAGFPVSVNGRVNLAVIGSTI